MEVWHCCNVTLMSVTFCSLNFSTGLHLVTYCLRFSTMPCFDWTAVKVILGMLLVYLCIELRSWKSDIFQAEG